MYVYAMCNVVVVVYSSSAIPVVINVAGVVDVVRIRVYRVSVAEMNLWIYTFTKISTVDLDRWMDISTTLVRINPPTNLTQVLCPPTSCRKPILPRALP